MTSDAFNKALHKAIDLIGEQRLMEEITKITIATTEIIQDIDTLTIVVNTGVHHLPPHLMRGEVFFASEGSLDFSNADSVKREFISIIEKVAAKLKQRAWKRIYLIPFGPANLSMLIKLVAYRVTHIDTIDIFHAGGGSYFELEIPLRPIVISAS